MKEKAPHVPAAFINAIAEEGTKEEAVQFLQETWNDYCEMKRQLASCRTDFDKALRESLEWRAKAETRLPEGLGSELSDAIAELSAIVGNPALSEAEIIREAVRRIRETVGAVKRMRAAGVNIPSPDKATSPHLTVVPVVATRKMLEAAGHACDGLNLSKMTRIERSTFKAQKRWAAMLAVATVPFGPQHALRETLPSPHATFRKEEQ